MLDQIKNFKQEGDDDKTFVDDAPLEPEDPRVAKFSVENPQKSAGHIKYTVTGVDDEGEFKEQRRFREFHALSVVLRTRWPGCYVPSIPEKKVVGAND